MDISISHYTAIGKRETNEDAHALLESEAGLLAIVADGLGGLENGEVASRQAISVLHNLLLAKSPDEDLLIDSIHQANDEIFRMQKTRHPMCTTVSVLWIGNNSVLAANVGDTRIYQFRRNQIVYQSVDHSVAQMAVFVGELNQQAIRTSKDRNKLTRVLGDIRHPRVDTQELDIRAGDRFLMCSDGFWETVTEADMIRIASESASADEWLSRMRQIIINANLPKQDNHTAIAMVVN